MSIALQKQIRDNSNDISAYLTDLQEWTKVIGQEEKNRSFAVDKSKKPAPPPVRGAVSIETNKDITADNPARTVERTGSKNESLARDSTSIKDYYKAWDSFDVDEEEKAIEKREADKPKSPVHAPISELAQQKRTTTAKPNMKVAVRSSVRAKSDEEFALAKKEEGNKLFAQQRTREARDAYTSGLSYLKEPSELRGTLQSNRAMCNLKLNDFGECVKDTTEVLEFDPTHIKARFRKAMAHSKLKQWKQAQEELTIVVKQDPSDAKAASELKSATRMLDEELKKRREHAKRLMTFKRSFTMPLKRLQIEERHINRLGEEIQEVPKEEASEPKASSTSIRVTTRSADAQKVPYVPRYMRSAASATVPERISASSVAAAAAAAIGAVSRGSTPNSTPPASPCASAESKATSSHAVDESVSAYKPPPRTRKQAPMRNFYDFEMRWRSAKTKDKRWELLTSVDLVKLVRESFSSELLLEMMEVCEGHADAHKVLAPLSGVRRWDIILSSLTRTERAKLEELITCGASANGENLKPQESIEKCEVPIIRQKQTIMRESTIGEKRNPKEPLICDSILKENQKQAAEVPCGLGDLD